MAILKSVCSVGGFRRLVIRWSSPSGAEDYERHFFGLTFRNPVGLAAGFDKNARYLRELDALGFGFIEIGTVTPKPQPGNDKPRLFRLPKDLALINRMGFNNDGVQAVATRLKAWKEASSKWQTRGRLPMIIGGNIGKQKTTLNEDAWKDYEASFSELFHLVDYFVVNVSSPNTPGLRDLQRRPALSIILRRLQALNREMAQSHQSSSRPLLLKISPDLEAADLDDIVDLAKEIGLDGLVVANTTIEKKSLSKKGARRAAKIGSGGLSGLPLFRRSTDLVTYIAKHSGEHLKIIGSGGIFQGFQAAEKILAGAVLVQVWTGFIYEGPGIVKKILSDFRVAQVSPPISQTEAT